MMCVEGLVPYLLHEEHSELSVPLSAPPFPSLYKMVNVITSNSYKNPLVLSYVSTTLSFSILAVWPDDSWCAHGF